MLGYNDYNFLTSKEWRDAIDKKNKDVIKRGQEILGFTGNDVDGIAGKATKNAYNTQMLEADQYYAPTKKAQFIPNENANQLYQDFNDSQVYGFNKDEAVNELNQEIYNEQVAKLESQIAQVEERIARNKRALTGKSYEDVNNKLGQLELDKIGFRFNSQPTNTDPTSFWRWNQTRQDTKEANDLINAEAKNKFGNTVYMWKNTRLPEGTAAREQMISNLNEAIRDGRNTGADVSELLTLKEQWENVTYGNNSNNKVNYGVGSETEQKAAELETVLATAKTSDELIKFRNGYKWKPEQLTKLDTKIAELKKKEKSNADEIEFREWVEKETGKKFTAFSKRVLDTYRNVWKNTRGK